MDIKKILNNKKLLIAIAVGIVLIIALVLIFLRPSDSTKEKTESLNEKLNELAIEFYETKYYTSLDDKEMLANFKDTGVNINITNIEVLLPLSDELESSLKEYECNFDQTKITIYPKSPYGVKDYEIKVEPSCKK